MDQNYRQAKTLNEQQFMTLLERIHLTSHDPLRDYVVVLLSFKGGLRVGEIAKLDWTDATDATGELADILRIPDRIAKKGSGRTIHIHPALKGALYALKETLFGTNEIPKGRTIRSRSRHREDVSPNSLQRYLSRLYRECGFDCTSHSGRRTKITNMARMASQYGCSLMDVMDHAGHRQLETAERYVEPSENLKLLVYST